MKDETFNTLKFLFKFGRKVLCDVKLGNLYEGNQEVDLNTVSIPVNNWGPKIVWGFKNKVAGCPPQVFIC